MNVIGLWLIAIVIAAGGGFFYGVNTGGNRVIAKQAKEDALINKVKADAMQGAAEEIAKIKPVNQTIVNEVQREIRTKTIYSECRNTVDGVRLINQAITGQPSPAVNNNRVPGNKPVKR